MIKRFGDITKNYGLLLFLVALSFSCSLKRRNSRDGLKVEPQAARLEENIHLQSIRESGPPKVRMRQSRDQWRGFEGLKNSPEDARVLIGNKLKTEYLGDVGVCIIPLRANKAYRNKHFQISIGVHQKGYVADFFLVKSPFNAREVVELESCFVRKMRRWRFDPFRDVSKLLFKQTFLIQ